MRHSVENYVDRILDACFDTGVGCDKVESYNSDAYKKYCKDNDMEIKWRWFGMWMYGNKINFDKEIYKYCKKFNTHSRDASHKLLSKYYDEWIRVG